MKFAKITLSVALLGALTLGMADDTATTDTTSTIDAQIEAIQTAPAQERVKLMNEFKQKLMTMNQEERMAAITQMQEKMQAKSGGTQALGQSMGENGQAFGNTMKEGATNHAQEMQMQANEQMNQMQNMNQQQAGNQYIQTVGASAIPGGAPGGTAGAPSLNTNMMGR